MHDTRNAPAQPVLVHGSGRQFVPLVLPAPAPAPVMAPLANALAADIRIAVRRDTVQVNVSWPQ